MKRRGRRKAKVKMEGDITHNKERLMRKGEIAEEGKMKEIGKGGMEEKGKGGRWKRRGRRKRKREDEGRYNSQ